MNLEQSEVAEGAEQVKEVGEEEVGNDDEEPPAQEESVREPEAPWYGKTRYEVVDHVLDQIAEKERANKLTPVEAASLRAQAPYLTTSMKDLGDSYQGPPKYLSQRDAPLEIPIEVVKDLFCAMDEDIDDRVTTFELKNYIAKTGVPIEEHLADEMFEDATKNRPVIHLAQKNQGLTIEEIQYAVRGRFSWNKKQKAWGVEYKKYRGYWLLLLLTVSDRLFALQVPKVIPGTPSPRISHTLYACTGAWNLATLTDI